VCACFVTANARARVIANGVRNASGSMNTLKDPHGAAQAKPAPHVEFQVLVISSVFSVLFFFSCLLSSLRAVDGDHKALVGVVDGGGSCGRCLLPWWWWLRLTNNLAR